MGKKILVLVGHPDPDTTHYCYALADAYIRGAENGAHAVKRIDVATVDVPFVRTYQNFYDGEAPAEFKAYQDTILWADHLVIIFPLWLGTMPALLKAFLEQVFRPGLAFSSDDDKMPKPKLKRKSARVIVTMGMPALFYRWYYRAHGVKNLKRNILYFCGIKPVRLSFIGMVESDNQKKHEDWLKRIEQFGAHAR